MLLKTELEPPQVSTDQLTAFPVAETLIERTPASPVRRGYLPLKRALEVAAAALMLLPTAPLIALVAIVVKLTSRGPAVQSNSPGHAR